MLPITCSCWEWKGGAGRGGGGGGLCPQAAPGNESHGLWGRPRGKPVRSYKAEHSVESPQALDQQAPALQQQAASGVNITQVDLLAWNSFRRAPALGEVGKVDRGGVEGRRAGRGGQWVGLEERERKGVTRETRQGPGLTHRHKDKDILEKHLLGLQGLPEA